MIEPEHGQRAVVWQADPAPAAGARPADPQGPYYVRTGVLMAVLVVMWGIDPDFHWWLLVPLLVLLGGLVTGVTLWQRARQLRPIPLAGLLYDPVGHWLTLTMATDRATVERSAVHRVRVRRTGPASARLRLLLDAGGHRYDTGDTSAEAARPVLDALRADGVQVRTETTS